MKYIKVAVITLILGLAIIITPMTINASDPTTEITTEQITTEETTGNIIDDIVNSDIEEQLETAKTWLIGAVIGLFSTGLGSLVVKFVLDKAKKKIEEGITDIKDKNKISQETADMLYKTNNETFNKINGQIKYLETTIADNLNKNTEAVQEIVAQQKQFMENLTKALREYMEEE